MNNRMIKYLAIYLWLVPGLCHAAYDFELKESLRCASLFRHYEYKHRIPGDTLYSISLNETGRLHSKKKIKLVWPWTVNVDGKGYFFDSKSEAVAFVRREMLSGKESIDVGCMQINLKHHPEAFRSLEHAFDPASNVAYGASFLKSKYDAFRDWHKAIAHYHSATEVLGEKYKNNIIKTAANISKYTKPFYEPEIDKSRKSYAKVQKRAIDQDEIPLKKQQRYKSNMMVHIPKQSRISS